jgi:tetratricopeptide (TPR) repeat protein
MALAKRMSNSDYSGLLSDLDGLEGSIMTAPPGVDRDEIFTYYRATACMMLKRLDCLTTAANGYLRRWPDGLYAQAVRGYLDNQQDQVFAESVGARDLGARLEEIAAARRAGTLTSHQADLQEAYAYFGAKQFREAARRFRALLDSLPTAEARLDVVQVLAIALEQAGDFDGARRVLEAAQERAPRLFREKGLHHHLRRLPR